MATFLNLSLTFQLYLLYLLQEYEDGDDMKDEKKLSKIKSDDKLKIEDIKKNSSSDVLHTIKRIKLDEAKFVGMLVIVILGIFCLCGYGVYLSIQKKDVGIKSGPLIIKFNDKDGMGDIVNITEYSGNNNLGFEVVDKNLSITNTSSQTENYIVYIKNYEDMINYDNCGDRQYKMNEVYFGFDNTLGKALDDVLEDGKYILKKGKITSNNVVDLNINFWVIDKKNEHFHGEIIVEYIK